MPKRASTHPDGESSSLHENALLKSQTAELIRAETSQKEVLKLVDFQLGVSNSICPDTYFIIPLHLLW